MNEILFAVTIFSLTLTVVFASIAVRERKKREKTLSHLRHHKHKGEKWGIDRTKLLLRALNLIREGIVIMDPYGRIVFTNQFARELLDISPEDHGKFFYQAIKNFDVVCMINESFNEKYRVWHEKKIKDRYVQITFGSDMDEKVLILIDITPVKKYENLKKDFIANVSHELKTPLASMKLSLETLEEECRGNESAEKFLRKAMERVKYMNQLIEDLITLSMLESIDFKVKWTRIELLPFFEKLLSDLSDFAERRKIEMILQVPPGTAVLADEKMLHAIFKNLLDNAIKYNKEGGKVFISAVEEKEEVKVEVRDTGVGIPDSHIPFIFERFYRVERSRSKRLGGTGLGLSIVKLAVGRLGGRVEVESKEGEGTRFVVSLRKG